MEEDNLEIQKELTNEEIKNLIYTIRGKQVMLDSDVAMLYHYETKKINQAVKRNIDRFPENFCFQLTEMEFQNLRCQIVTLNENEKNNDYLRSQIATLNENIEEKNNYLNWSQNVTSSENIGNNGNCLRSQNVTLNENKRGQHRKYLPYVFTEQGIAMLSGLLKNSIAVQVSINIMNAFVEMRKFLITNGQVFERLTNVEYKLLEHDKRFNEIFNRFQLEESIKQKIFFDGQIWDSYSLIVDLIKKANNKITIIDNYVDDSVSRMLSKKKENVEVNILTSEKSKIQNLDIEKFNTEYPILKVEKTNKFHDRFIILDEKEMYHLGASIKDLGKKCFGINKIEDIELIEKVINL